MRSVTGTRTGARVTGIIIVIVSITSLAVPALAGALA